MHLLTQFVSGTHQGSMCIHHAVAAFAFWLLVQYSLRLNAWTAPLTVYDPS
ncbi:hypothetical protein D3C80_1954130 [compost metagenome]